MVPAYISFTVTVATVLTWVQDSPLSMKVVSLRYLLIPLGKVGLSTTKISVLELAMAVQVPLISLSHSKVLFWVILEPVILMFCTSFMAQTCWSTPVPPVRAVKEIFASD